MTLRRIIRLAEAFLVENALSKGSQQVIKNSKIVADLADTVREEAMLYPARFPNGFYNQVRRQSDEDVARWFLEQLDKIEQQGYAGVQYSRDGVNNLWLVNRYIAGAHNWEDIQGTAAMNLSKWYFLKNRNMLDPAHANLGKFGSVRELAKYMIFHYNEKLQELEEKLRQQAMKKSVRAIKLVDNSDYKIYLILNRPASVLYGSGSTWCTSSASYAGHWHRYANEAMVFQLYPTQPEEVQKEKAGRVIKGPERYQFDAGGPYFMDIADDPANKKDIQKKFPYLYNDLVTALSTKKQEIEDFMKKSAEDPTLQSDDDKVKQYDVDKEIEKLDKLKNAGWLTDKKRPPAASAEVPETPPA